MIQKEQQSLLIYLVLGLLIGVGLDGLFYQKVTHIYPYLWISSFALIFALAFDFRHRIRIVISSALIAAIACSPFLFMGPDTNSFDNTNLLVSVICFPYTLMIAHSFHFAYHLDNRIRMRYTSLFYAVWNTIPLLMIAAVFTFIAKLLIWLTGAIFSTFQFKTIANFLFSNHHFWIISTVCLYITGIGIARQNLTILDSLRFVILKLFYYLYPFLAIISLLYLILYFTTEITGNTPESSTIIFVVLSIFGIIFFNAIFQDGEAQSYQSNGLRLFLKSYRLMLLLITVLTAQLLYPESKQVINALLLLAILVLYGLSYGISAVLTRKHAKQTIKTANVVIAILYVISYLIINNPFKPILPNNHQTTWGKSSLNTRKLSIYNESLPNLKTKLVEQDTKLKQLGLTWQAPSANHKPIEALCRSNIKPYGWLVGTIVNHQCQITNSYQVFKEKNYQILTGDPSILTWRPSKDTITIPLSLEVDYKGIKPQIICRVKINNQYQIGSLYANGCAISKNNRLNWQYWHVELLTLNAENYPQKMGLFLDGQIENNGLKFMPPPIKNEYIAGISDKGNIGICRGIYMRGLQIGSYQDNQCTISYGGKAVTLTDFTVLTNVTDKPNVHWQPRQYRAILKPDDNLALGYEIIANGSIRPLEACRGIHDNIIHVGKMIDSGCNIASGNQEIALKSGCFTTLQPK